MPGGRVLRTVLIAVVCAAVAGCSGVSERSAPGPAATDAPATVEPGGPPPTVESGGQEQGSEGGVDGVGIELAGLPVGNDGVSTRVGDAWCTEYSWSQFDFPAGVRLDITAVAVVDVAGTQVRTDPCGGRPNCIGSSATSGSLACAVLVVPPAGTPAVKVRLDGRITCADQATCDALRPGLDTGTTPLLTAPAPDPSTGDSGGSSGGTDSSPSPGPG